MKRSAERYDFIIVGGGFAGGFLTLRLSEYRPLKVLLLEAGPTDAHWSIRIPAAARSNYIGGPCNWAFQTEPEPHMNGRTLYQPRGKVLGGSSSLNGMVFVRNIRIFHRMESPTHLHLWALSAMSLKIYSGCLLEHALSN